MKTSLFLSLMVMMCGALGLPAETVAQESAAEQAVREVVDRFKGSLRGGQADAVMELLHPDVRIYERGHAETRDEYAAGHLEADMAFLQAVQSTTRWDRVVAGQKMAIYMSEYSVKGTFRDRAIDSHRTETIVLVPTDGGWRILHIHWSSR